MARRLLFDGALGELGQLPLEGSDSINAVLNANTADAAISAEAASVVSIDSSTILDNVVPTLLGDINITSVVLETLASTSIITSVDVIINSNSSNVLSDSTISSSVDVIVNSNSSNILSDSTISSSVDVHLDSILSITLEDATVDSAGEVLPGVTAALSVNLNDSAITSDGTADVVGALLITLAGPVINSSIDLLIDGGLSRSLGDTGVTSSTDIYVSGISNTQLGDASSASSVSVVVIGSSVQILDSVNNEFAGSLSISGTSTTTLDTTLISSDIESAIVSQLMRTTGDAIVTSAVGIPVSASGNYVLDNSVVISESIVSIGGTLSQSIGCDVDSSATIRVNSTLVAPLQDSLIEGNGYVVDPVSSGILLITLEDALSTGVVNVEVHARVIIDVDSVSISSTSATRLNGALDVLSLDSCTILGRGHRMRGPGLNNTSERGGQEYRDFLNDIIIWMSSSGTTRFTINELYSNRVVEFASKYPSKQNILRIMNWLNSRSYVYRIRGTRSLDFYWYITDSGRKFASGSTVRSRSARQ